ncbi:hypothetical protein SLEP1_g6906 [Rubroshorea leprosula]|uniref:Uncharacterized protein n=1 Tax=Rubroshorea leprosula TaxID=152421 RepID=A0AAV5I4Z3_9ROSI|nr:hypothetical protein SLEP1_g6906 [Rubroshorea leprosula]
MDLAVAVCSCPLQQQCGSDSSSNSKLVGDNEGFEGLRFRVKVRAEGWQWDLGSRFLKSADGRRGV